MANEDVNEDCLLVYETIEKNKPKVYSDTIDQICSIINKHKEKSEKRKSAGKEAKRTEE